MADQPIQQRLAAVLAADVVGYTRLMEEDTEGTVAAWKAARDEIITPVVSDHSGRVVKLTGDGFLAEFPTVHEAVECGIAMQEGFAASSLEFRIGINLGDIIDDGQDIHGEGVNVAARIEALADPGGISISGEAYAMVRNRVEANYEDRGEHDVKNVSASVRIYAIRLNDSSTSGAASAGKAITDKPSIAVLPFENMSNDPEQDYFADGLAEDILTGLARSKLFFVISRNSSFFYKGQAINIQKVGHELGAQYLLEGSVRKMGDRLRVTVQLIEVETSNHVWAERFDGSLSDVFDFQDQVTTKIVGTISPELRLAEADRVRRLPPDSMSAWDCVMRAAPFMNENSHQGYEEALKLLDQAVELDQNYSVAHAMLAQCHLLAASNNWVGKVSDQFAKAEREATVAQRLDPSNPFAYSAKAHLHTLRGEFEDAVEAAERALEIDPSLSEARATLAHALSFTGQIERTFHEIDEGDRTSPKDPERSLMWQAAANAHFAARNYHDAITASRKVMLLKPDWYGAYVIHGASNGLLGNLDQAEQSISRLRELLPKFTLAAAIKYPMFRRPEDADCLVEGLRLAGLGENS